MIKSFNCSECQFSAHTLLLPDHVKLHLNEFAYKSKESQYLFSEAIIWPTTVKIFLQVKDERKEEEASSVYNSKRLTFIIKTQMSRREDCYYYHFVLSCKYKMISTLVLSA